MSEKLVRNRSKSASRRSRSNSKTKPIIIHRKKKSIEIDNDEKTGTAEYVTIEKRVTRRSKIHDISNEKNEIENEPALQTSIETDIADDEKIENNEILTEICGNKALCRQKAGNIAVYCLIVAFIPVIVLLNKMCENGAAITYPDWRKLKLEYFTDIKMIGMVTLAMLYLCALAHIPIGGAVNLPGRGGCQTRNRCNGFVCLIIFIFTFLSLIYMKYISLNVIYDNYYHLIGSSITVAIVFSFFMFLKSYFVKQSQITHHPGNLFYGFMMGREINPRILGLDFKFFYEFRPGFTGWALLNIVFCLKDLENNNYESINPSLLLSAFGQIIYCFDALLFEGDSSTKSFMVNGQFGFLHCFGNQVIVPFFFTLTTRAIQINKFTLPLKCVASIFMINIIGYAIYRTSNIQKSSFQRNPYSVHLNHLKTLTNSRGHQILVGGWWGFLRHPNYLGDIIMSLSWSLYAGLHLTVCWCYPIYLIIFVIFQCFDDDRRHSFEHGSTWDEYQRCVPYKLIPFVF